MKQAQGWARARSWFTQFPAALRDVALIRTIAMLGACCVLYLTPMVFHQAQFSLHDGSVACGPATEPAKTWPVKVEGGRVFLQL